VFGIARAWELLVRVLELQVLVGKASTSHTSFARRRES